MRKVNYTPVINYGMASSVLYEGDCCTGANSPPWFNIELTAPTIDIIEVNICCDQGTMDEDTPVELIEIYVQ